MRYLFKSASSSFSNFSSDDISSSFFKPFAIISALAESANLSSRPLSSLTASTTPLQARKATSHAAMHASSAASDSTSAFCLCSSSRAANSSSFCFAFSSTSALAKDAYSSIPRLSVLRAASTLS